jgi:hypothetical protein
MPERPKGAVCKIAGVAYGGSNPPPPTDNSTGEASLIRPGAVGTRAYTRRVADE